MTSASSGGSRPTPDQKGSVRFLHTADWQLGMRRHFLSPESQARFTDARIEAVRTIGRLAKSEGCEFVAVAGDVFESNQLQEQTIRRALDAMEFVSVPVLLLPGNHDPLDAASIYRSEVFKRSRPKNVRVLESATAIEVRPGVQVVGAPWQTKRPLVDLVGQAYASCLTARDTVRICVGHGALNAAAPNPLDPALIDFSAAQHAIAEGRIHYLALGDRHSFTRCSDDGRICYAGSPEPTDYDEVDPGKVVIVEVGKRDCRIEPVQVGTWQFVRQAFPLNEREDINRLQNWLTTLQRRDRIILKLSFTGTLRISDRAYLDVVLDDARQVFGAVEEWERETDLAVRADDDDFSGMALAGFAEEALQQLRTQARNGGATGRTAENALSLLYRLSGGGR